jgi:hypothetical protein
MIDKKKIENFKQNIKDALAFGIIEKENYERLMRMINEIEKKDTLKLIDNLIKFEITLYHRSTIFEDVSLVKKGYGDYRLVIIDSSFIDKPHITEQEISEKEAKELIEKELEFREEIEKAEI